MKKNNDNNKKKGIELISLLIALIIVCGVILVVFMQTNKKQDDKTLAYTDLIKQVAAKNVEKVEMTTGSTSITVTLKKEIDENGVIIESNSIENITNTENIEEEVNEKLIKKAIVPNTQSFIELIQDEVAKGNDIELIQKTPSVLTQIPSYIFSLLPTIIMVALFVMIFKMQGLTEKGEVYDETERKVKIKFDDVAGLDEEKGELIEIVDFLKNPKKYTDMGAKIPKGILLYGKPGTGKTLIAKAIAGEAGVPFISMSGSEFIEMFAGLGASRVRKNYYKRKRRG